MWLRHHAVVNNDSNLPISFEPALACPLPPITATALHSATLAFPRLGNGQRKLLATQRRKQCRLWHGPICSPPIGPNLCVRQGDHLIHKNLRSIVRNARKFHQEVGRHRLISIFIISYALSCQHQLQGRILGLAAENQLHPSLHWDQRCWARIHLRQIRQGRHCLIALSFRHWSGHLSAHFEGWHGNSTQSYRPLHPAWSKALTAWPLLMLNNGLRSFQSRLSAFFLGQSSWVGHVHGLLSKMEDGEHRTVNIIGDLSHSLSRRKHDTEANGDHKSNSQNEQYLWQIYLFISGFWRLM